MNRIMIFALVLLSLLPFTAHARFTQADSWMGIDKQPITLNKYTYANVDPVNHTDPTGHFGLVSSGVAQNINATLQKMATAGAGLSLAVITTGTLNDTRNTLGERRWSIWDIMTTSYFKSTIDSSTQTTTTTKKRRRQRNPNDGHHTIPIYLCGSTAQQLSYIERSKHAALHTGLASVQVALHAAETAADRFIPLARRRSGPILSLAETRTGRSIIAGAIQSYYQTAGWWGQGLPAIGTIYPFERQQFIGGKTSLPTCKRGG